MSLRRCFWMFFLVGWVSAEGTAEVLTLPRDARPEWLRQEGIVMAGSWEPLLFRVRRDGSDGYVPTPEQRQDYLREHSPEMIDELKQLGVNFVMMHCYKGFGLESERESMADAVRFSALCHEAGLHVGVYNYSGAFGWELLFEETPEAKDWVVLDNKEQPRQYGSATYRYYWNRNHPDAVAFYRNLVRFAVEDIQTDLVHFDNYSVGPGKDSFSVRAFRRYLTENFTAAEREEMSIADVDTVQPPMSAEPRNFLRFAWLDFSCQYLADSYHDMSRYARSLRDDVLVECNPIPVGMNIRPPIHHGRQLTGGEAFWDEAGYESGFRDGELHSRIRMYKIARRMDNIAFAYSRNPLELAEAMAFNLDCVGCVTWFEYGRLAEMPGTDRPVAKELPAYIRFFNTRRELFRDTRVVADVAILRSFPSQVFADPKHARQTADAEQELIENRVPFQIIFDNHLSNLDRYRCLVLAGCVALSDPQIQSIQEYVSGGGKLCVVGPAGTHDEWMRPRRDSFLAAVESRHCARVEETADLVAATRRVCVEPLSYTVKAPDGVGVELTERESGRLVHLVNYRDDGPIENVEVRLCLPNGRHAQDVRIASPLQPSDTSVAHEEHDGTVVFTIPKINVYAVAQVDLR